MRNIEGNTSPQQAEAPRVMDVDEAAKLHEARQAVKRERAAKAAAKLVGAEPAAEQRPTRTTADRKKGLKALARYAQKTLAGGAKRKAAKPARAEHKKAEHKKGAAPKKAGLTLRAEVHDVLQRAGKGKPMTVAAIANAIAERGRYKRPNGKPVSPGHIAFLAIRSPELTYGKGGKKTNVGLDLRALKALQK